MAEQASNEQSAVDSREALKTKWAGQTCITMFVVFVISLLSFGLPPFAKVTLTNGYGALTNAISCLGVAMGIFAFIFLPTNFRRVLRLATARKVLGLIGCSGLILHTILALFFPLPYGARPILGGHLALARQGPETWVVGSSSYKIAGTYYLRLPEGLQYTIEHPYRFSQADASMDDERALEVAFPLMKHAYVKGLYKRSSVTEVGRGTIVASRIGVALSETQDGNTVRGYRVARSLDEISKKIEQESASSPTMPASQ